MASRIIDRAIQSLTQDQVVIDREQWLKEAEAAENAGAPRTCAAIVRNTIWRGVEDDDRKRTWLDDAQSCLSRNAIDTARAIYAHALGVFPAKKGIWVAACELERKHGSREAHEQMLRKAVGHCPKAEILWLMAAKDKWLGGDVPGAREVLMEAFAANPDSEAVWLAAAKLEWENQEFARARILLEKACARSPTSKVWMKRALLERECGDLAAELRTLDTAMQSFPDFDKFYMMAGQACTQLGDGARARAYYQAGLRRCPKSVALWVLAAKLEQAQAGVVKARSLLELARLKNPKTPALWLQAIRLERSGGNDKLGATLMAKALQENPDSGLLRAEEIRTAARADRRGKSREAVKRCDNDPHVICAVADLFVDERKYPTARKWFNRAVTLDENTGDVWAMFLAFELQHGDEASRADVVQRCLGADPTYGELWCQVSKDPANARWDKTRVLHEVANGIIAARQEQASNGPGPAAMVTSA